MRIPLASAHHLKLYIYTKLGCTRMYLGHPGSVNTTNSCFSTTMIEIAAAEPQHTAAVPQHTTDVPQNTTAEAQQMTSHDVLAVWRDRHRQ